VFAKRHLHLICFLFLTMSCIPSYAGFFDFLTGGNGPKTGEIRQTIARELPGYVSLNDFQIEASQNLGSDVEPDYRARFNSQVRLEEDLYLHDGSEDQVTFLKRTKPRGFLLNIYGKTRSQLYQGTWRHEISSDGDPLSALGRPASAFAGVTVIRGSEDERRYFRSKPRNLVSPREGARIIEKSQNLETVPKQTIEDHGENARAAFDVSRLFDGITDNDWQTGLVPEYFPIFFVVELPEVSILDTATLFNNSVAYWGAEGNSATKEIQILTSMTSDPNSFKLVGAFPLRGPEAYTVPGGGSGVKNDYSPQAFDLRKTEAKFIRFQITKSYWPANIDQKQELFKSILGVSLAEIAVTGHPVP